MNWSTPSLASGVVQNQLVVLAKALGQVSDSLVGGWREGLVDIHKQVVLGLEFEVFSDEGKDPTNLLFTVDLKKEKSINFKSLCR